MSFNGFLSRIVSNVDSVCIEKATFVVVHVLFIYLF